MNRRTSSISILALACFLLLPSPTSAMLHPVQSRFLQRDPIGYPDGTNRFEWLRGNPFSGFDPLGLASITVRMPEGWKKETFRDNTIGQTRAFWENKSVCCDISAVPKKRDEHMTITLYVHLTIAIDKDKVDRGFKGNEQHEIEGIYGHEMQHAKMVEKVVAKMKGEWEPKFAIKEAKSYTEHDRCVKDMNQEIKEAVTDINNYITHVGFGHAGDKNNLMFVFLDRTKVGNVKTSGMGYPKEPGHGEDDAYPKNRYYEEGKGANEIETPSEDEEKRWLRIKVQ